MHCSSAGRLTLFHVVLIPYLRFHRLPEFDQGKRSCRRRLAGHNERRRKPPPGSLLSSRLGRLSSSLFDGGSPQAIDFGFFEFKFVIVFSAQNFFNDTSADKTNRSGGFLLDFTSYSRDSKTDLWLGYNTSEQVSGIHSRSNMWPGNFVLLKSASRAEKPYYSRFVFN